jgi:hypothetical protein
VRAALVSLAVCAVSAIAHADERCNVTYVTVPAGVQEVIDGWVAAEPHCVGTIALRVIATKDGYFLFAERPDGTVHERLVPDVTAAGVLVASWVADSWHVEHKHKHKKLVAKEPIDRVEITDDPAPREYRRWLSVGGTVVPEAPGADVGFRVEADLLVHGGWRIGVAAQKVQDTMEVWTGYESVSGQINDWSVGGVLSRTARWRGFELRGGLGVLALRSKPHIEDFSGDNNPAYPGQNVMSSMQIQSSPAFEASLSMSRDLGERWGISVTGAATRISQDWTNDDGMFKVRREVQRMWVLSLRRKI